MKKDIEIPQANGVGVAIALEHNPETGNEEWYAHLINRRAADIEMIVIVSQGFNETQTTSLFRRRIDKLAAGQSTKFELMQPEVFALDNRFQLTFFENGKLYDREFLFERNIINKEVIAKIPEIGHKGLLAI